METMHRMSHLPPDFEGRQTVSQWWVSLPARQSPRGAPETLPARQGPRGAPEALPTPHAPCCTPRLQTLSGMSASDELDDSQVRQMLFDLESAYNAFNRFLHA